MAVVISLDDERRRRRTHFADPASGTGTGHPAGSARRSGAESDPVAAVATLGILRRNSPIPPSPEEVARLERAVMRLDHLARPEGGRDRLRPDVERDLLTVVGELAMGWIDRAADRAEELCERLAGAGR
ncbi:MAG TPA: hypothetical protein VEM41_08060 [Actinomycetota bacterium]|nr:hypothetical protein [Actinomycetota bacterium]